MKEVREEAGLAVRAERIIAVQDRNKHNQPPYAYGICKIFVLCTSLGGDFVPNAETLQRATFALNELPPLAVEKNTAAQIALCFSAYAAGASWQTFLD